VDGRDKPGHDEQEAPLGGETFVMHDIRWIREHPEEFDRGLKRRGLEPLARELIAIDERRRAAITRLEQMQARRNTASKEIGEAKKAKDEARAQALMAEVGELKTSIPAMEAEAKKLEDDLLGSNGRLAQLPNLPADDVPDGADEHANVEHHRFGAKRDYGFPPKQHFELGEALGQMDFETAAKLSGARFVVLQKGLARMERALGQFMLDVHTQEHGYTEVSPPLLVRDEAMFGTGQLPKFEEDQFFTDPRTPDWVDKTMQYIREHAYSMAPGNKAFSRDEVDKIAERIAKNAASLFMIRDYFDTFEAREGPPLPKRLGLIPTAEVSLTNLVRESILDEAELPLRFTACTPCFRAEAGAAGKDTRGMIRQHQFTKVELVSITTPERSRDEHERMLSSAEEVLRRLDLHHRVVTLCTGDMGFASQKTYDIEVWLPGQSAYREISSCSVCGDFQARRMQARYRTKEDRNVRLVHTLNGSGVAVGRALIAVMETYQQGNGSIAVPDALEPYMGGVKVIGE
jgi:seryl-tRNA synthetase